MRPLTEDGHGSACQVFVRTFRAKDRAWLRSLTKRQFQRAGEWSEEVDPQDPLEDSAIVLGSRYAPIYPGDVGQEVNPAVLLLNLLKGRRESVKVRQITANEPDASEIRSIVYVDPHHLRSARNEVLGQLTPDSRGGARNYPYMVGEVPTA